MITRIIGLALLSIVLQACNGTSGENGDDPFGDAPQVPAAPIIQLTLSILDENCDSLSQNSFKSDQIACVEATLTSDGVGVANEIISFTTGIGSFDIANKLTNENGVAQVFLSSTDNTLGAATVTASYESEEIQSNIEFTAADELIPSTPFVISLSMLNQAGDPTLRFRANQQVILTAELIDEDGQAVADQILTFSATRGNLSVSDALTNQDGIAEVSLTGLDQDIGAGIASVSLVAEGDTPFVDTVNFEIQPVDAVEEDVVRIGYFDGSEFIDGVLGISGADANLDVTVSAGATLGFLVGLADADGNPIVGSTPIVFTSNCVQEGTASIDTTVSTVNGRASSTYEDISCATSGGNDDIITATVTVNSTPLSISRQIELLPEDLGSIEFVSVSPSEIVFQGTGGQGSESISTVTFQVNGTLGNPLAQQLVEFELSTQVGGLTLSPIDGLTNSDGQVSTRVTAGTIPTAVRVIASTSNQDGDTITTQSDQLTVNTGLPDQDSFSLSTQDLNPEANNINGQEVTVTAYLADTFNNPVPDGTAVSFTSEGGQIEPSCITSNGSCSVVWTSADPRVDDHRITILATAIGHESFFDNNGNNIYEDSDGGPLDLNEDAGFGGANPSTTGFSDMSEAWRDDNENLAFDITETFLDFDNSGSFSLENGAFDGPQCQATDCGASGLHVRRALVMIMSSSQALMSFFDENGELANNQQGATSTPLFSIPKGSSRSLSLLVSDTAQQVMPSDSLIDISANNGDLAGDVLTTVSKTNRPGGSRLNFVITNPRDVAEPPIDSTITATVTTPAGFVTRLSIIVTLE